MPYTANPLDPTTPTGATQAQYIDEELRAIKTKLVAHETAVTTTLPNADTALDERLDDLEAETGYRNKQYFAASGTFTVPAGITSVRVTGCGGGIDGYAGYQDSAGAQNWTLIVPRRDAFQRSVVHTVVPAAVLTVTVGVNGVVEPQAPVADQRATVATVATASSFDTLSFLPRKPGAGIYADGLGQLLLDDETNVYAGYASLVPGSVFPASLDSTFAAAVSSTDPAHEPYILVEW